MAEMKNKIPAEVGDAKRPTSNDSLNPRLKNHQPIERRAQPWNCRSAHGDAVIDGVCA